MSSSDSMASEQSSSPPPTMSRWAAYTGLWQAWSWAAWFYFEIVFRELRRGNVLVLTRLSDVGAESFAKWFITLGHHFSKMEEQSSVPSLVASAYGTVLELGPGTGNQLPRFDRTKVKHIYGLEPNEGFAATLDKKIKEEGMENLYTTILCGAEEADAELALRGVAPGTVDCILSIQVLCCVKDPEALVRQLHRLLKPGGELIFWEHGRNEKELITRIVQRVWNLIWPPLIGGCQLNRPIKQILLGAASWDVVAMDGEETPFLVMPRSWGRLAKK